jgi:hypothetical protein
MAFPVQASRPCTPGALPQRPSCLALLREQLIHVRGGQLRKKRGNAFIASQSYGCANKVLDGSSAFGFHPSPRSVGDACFGSCSLLRKIEGQAADFDPLAEVRHLFC